MAHLTTEPMIFVSPDTEAESGILIPSNRIIVQLRIVNSTASRGHRGDNDMA
jgi:hypothetical protein